MTLLLEMRERLSSEWRSFSETEKRVALFAFAAACAAVAALAWIAGG